MTTQAALTKPTRARPRLDRSPTPPGRAAALLKRIVLFLGALTSLFVSMVPPVAEGCRYAAFLENGVPFASTHGSLAVNGGVLASELLLVASAVALLWLVLDTVEGRRRPGR